jgi:hypothetical protein
MAYILHLDFNPHDADHRQVADWLTAQPDPAEAVVRLVKAANEGARRLLQWEELATLLVNDIQEVRAPVNDIQEVRAPLAGQSPEKRPKPEVQENPESAQRLDSMFG